MLTEQFITGLIISAGLQRHFRRVQLTTDHKRHLFRIEATPKVFLGAGKRTLDTLFPADIEPEIAQKHVESFLVKLEEAKAFRVLELARRPATEDLREWVEAIQEVADA
jgi:hypothetical protein